MIQKEELAIKIDIQLQFRSKEPLADQVRRAIFELIQRGELPEDSPLPTVRELAAQLGVNFNTVARAYRALDKEGWLITRQGRGTVVTHPVAALMEDPYKGMIRHLAAEIQQIAKQFGVIPSEVLQAIGQQIQTKPEAEKPPRRKRKKVQQHAFALTSHPFHDQERPEEKHWIGG